MVGNALIIFISFTQSLPFNFLSHHFSFHHGNLSSFNLFPILPSFCLQRGLRSVEFTVNPRYKLGFQCTVYVRIAVVCEILHPTFPVTQLQSFFNPLTYSSYRNANEEQKSYLRVIAPGQYHRVWEDKEEVKSQCPFHQRE